MNAIAFRTGAGPPQDRDRQCHSRKQDGVLDLDWKSLAIITPSGLWTLTELGDISLDDGHDCSIVY